MGCRERLYYNALSALNNAFWCGLAELPAKLLH